MGDVRDPERDQAAPVPNDRPSAHDLVVEDLQDRKAYGLNKYQSLLQAGNGRNSLRDLYEELMDAVVYVRTELEERSEGISFPWDMVDRNPESSVKCLLQHAPYTSQLMQVVVLRHLATQIHNGAEDSKLQELYDFGFNPWLTDLANRIEEMIIAELRDAAAPTGSPE